MKRNTFLKTLIGLPFVAPLLAQGTKVPTEEVTFFTPEMLNRNNFGLFIINSKVKRLTKENMGYAATVAWKLGYQHAYWKNSDGTVGEFPRYGKMNFLTDGWFYAMAHSDEELCDKLNNDPHGEKFRLMTKEEVLFIIQNRKQGFL